MAIHSCRHCDAPFETIQRNGESHICVCGRCGQDYCSQCQTSDAVGAQTWISRCPVCGSSRCSQFAIEDRFSIFSDSTDLREYPHSLAVSFVPRSRKSLRSEGLAIAAAERLSELQIKIALLDERDRKITDPLAARFPDQFRPDPDFGTGAIFWFTFGEPVAVHGGRPYLAKLDVLDISKRAWMEKHGEIG